MDRETVIQLAWETGMAFQGGFTRVVECVTQGELERFANAIEAKTLEMAARVCDAEASVEGIAQKCAAAIRALKDTP